MTTPFVQCLWPPPTGEGCPMPAVRLRADRAGHAWIPACADHCADAAPEDLQAEGAWLLPMEEP